MMQTLTRTQIGWAMYALKEVVDDCRKEAMDENHDRLVRAVANKKAENLDRICDILQEVLDNPKSLRIAVD